MARPDRVPSFAAGNPQAAAEAIAHCFGCGPANPQGLHLEPKREGDRTVVEFQGARVHAGWDSVYHGGIVATVLDEVAAFAMFQQGSEFFMTRKLSVEYKRRVHWTKPLRAEAWVTQRDAQRALVACRILQDGEVCTEGEAEFRVLPAPPPRGA